MQLTFLKGYPDMVGRRRIYCGTGVGPTSYSQTTGDVLSNPGYDAYWDMVFVTPPDSTNTYYAIPRLNATGPRATWSLHWYDAATFTEVSNATNLSTYTLQVAGFGGQY